ncbi:MAG: hypothetical protein LC792_21990 [Actinobacteria bacterium]|nr:hypothetical protein [Actinomycetota bacterium]
MLEGTVHEDLDDVVPDSSGARAVNEGDLEPDGVGMRPVERRDGDVGVERCRRVGRGHVDEDDMHAVRLVIEAQVAHAPAVAVVRADRDGQTGLLDGLGRPDFEAGREERSSVTLAGGLGEPRREGLTAESAVREEVRRPEGLRLEAIAGGVRVVGDVLDLDVIRTGLRPAVLPVDVAGGVAALEVDRTDRRGGGVRRSCQGETGEAGHQGPADHEGTETAREFAMEMGCEEHWVSSSGDPRDANLL